MSRNLLNFTEAFNEASLFACLCLCLSFAGYTLDPAINYFYGTVFIYILFANLSLNFCVVVITIIYHGAVFIKRICNKRGKSDVKTVAIQPDSIEVSNDNSRTINTSVDIDH